MKTEKAVSKISPGFEIVEEPPAVVEPPPETIISTEEASSVQIFPGPALKTRVSVEEAFEIVEAAIATGYRPSNQQLDMFAMAMLKRTLPESEIDWVKEIAETNRVPIWLSLICQYRRSQEQGAAHSLFLDDGWDKLADDI